MPFFHPAEKITLAGKVLVVPVVSTANVSQLAADLLIASLGLHRIGIFDPRDLVPVVGGREDGEDGITTPLELHGSTGSEVLVIQQRSPALKSRKQDYIDSLLGFIKESGISSVLFLSGVDLSNRTDAQMMTPTYFIRPPNAPELSSAPLSGIKDLPIPAYTSPVPQRPSSLSEEPDIPFIPGGGLTRRILSSIPSWSVSTAALLQFVLEGDNRADANLLAAVAAKVLAIDIRVWKQPSSWQQGLFGTPHDQTLYG
ncbi:hypothetical protein PLICRDRAFT_50798 [Plicaturopsis crispa FD-325 SS-3]|nr:hypothetical protein PLICRDRAFT_50798 [Plicaturopsis crispa FD-325 SS-3]